MAGSIAGIWRATQDIDIVARVRIDQTDALEAALSGEFYADAAAMREATQSDRVFNLIHYGSGIKFDIFPILQDPYYQVAFCRRRKTELRLSGGRALAVYAATAEDIILAKLVWYREGGGVSETQLNDVRGISSVQKGRLDFNYIHTWAAHLGFTELLETILFRL